MLPDYPEIKKQLQTNLMQGADFTQRGLISKVQKLNLREGKRWATIYEDGHREDSEIGESSLMLEFKREELEQLSPEEIEQKFLGGIKEFGLQIEREMLEHLTQKMEQSGRVLQGTKPYLSGEDFLKMLEVTEVDFDEDGNPTSVLLMTSEGTRKALEEYDKIKDDPEFKARHEDLKRKKIEEFNAREARRCLVG